MERSEDDDIDAVLFGYMELLKNALSSLPLDVQDEVKAATGADIDPVVTPNTSVAEAASGSAVTTTTSADSTTASLVSARVTAAAGHLVGGMWGGKGCVGEVEGSGQRRGGRGLVRELVERGLFSLPHERGHAFEDTEGSGGGVGDGVGDGTGDDGDEVGA